MKTQISTKTIFCFIIVIFGVKAQQMPNEILLQKYQITHKNSLAYDNKIEVFPENFTLTDSTRLPTDSKIKGMYLEVYLDRIVIIEFNRVENCFEKTQVFSFAKQSEKEIFKVPFTRYFSKSFLGDCNGKPKLSYGMAKLFSQDFSWGQMKAGKIKPGSELKLWYYCGMEKEGEKTMLKIGSLANL